MAANAAMFIDGHQIVLKNRTHILRKGYHKDTPAKMSSLLYLLGPTKTRKPWFASRKSGCEDEDPEGVVPPWGDSAKRLVCIKWVPPDYVQNSLGVIVFFAGKINRHARLALLPCFCG